MYTEVQDGVEYRRIGKDTMVPVNSATTQDTTNVIPPPPTVQVGGPVQTSGSTTSTPGTTDGGTGGTTGTGTNMSATSATVVPGQADPNDPSQINVADYGGQLVSNPGLHFGDNMEMSKNTPIIDPNAAGTSVPDQSPMNYSGTNVTAATANNVDPRTAQGYQAELTQENIAQNGQMTAQQGEVSQNAVMEAPQIDVDSHAKGETELGKALMEYAEQDLNTVDPKATVKGQLEMLQADFTGPDGEPIIPIWAQGAARQISKIAAFKGMTGTAATAAMSQAIMEASLPVATADAQFFQTLTLENLDNKQQSTINRANILSRMEEMNFDAKTAAAIQNAKAFLEMDLANLSNRQQAEVINTQARVQSILEDAKAVNTSRMFEAQSQNEMDMFYDQLNSQINQFNANMINETAQFNAQLENQREQFYRDMQYNIDVANANWRQTVTMQNNQNKFEAAAMDVRNKVDLSVEQLNQIWDRSDAILDYAWKSAENELGRDHAIALQTLQGAAESKKASQAGFGQVIGTIAGNLSSALFKSWF